MYIEVMCALLGLYVIGFELNNLISWENCEWNEDYGCKVQFSAGENHEL